MYTFVYSSIYLSQWCQSVIGHNIKYENKMIVNHIYDPWQNTGQNQSEAGNTFASKHSASVES